MNELVPEESEPYIKKGGKSIVPFEPSYILSWVKHLYHFEIIS